MTEEETEQTGPRITKKWLRDHCKQRKLYMTPELNDKLYLHYQGFSKIEQLEEYTGLKALWLESNGITKIEGLDHQPQLRYLMNNLIGKLENLESLLQLDTLALSNNHVGKIENIEKLTKLHTLQLDSNQLETLEDVEQLTSCPSIGVLELSNNRISDPGILDILSQLPNLGVLHLSGNPVIGKIANYRKTMICRLQRLTYLDDRPVFPKDRRLAEAWQRGGSEAEEAERDLMDKEESDRDRRNFLALEQLQREYRKGLTLSEQREIEEEDKEWAEFERQANEEVLEDSKLDSNSDVGGSNKADALVTVEEKSEETVEEPEQKSRLIMVQPRAEIIRNVLRHAGHSHEPIRASGKTLAERAKEGDMAKKVTWVGLGSNVLMTGGKFAAGVLGNSAALVADSIHSLSDLVSDIVTLGALWLGRQPPSEKFPYGLGKFESLGTLAVSGFLIASGYGMVLHSIEHFQTEQIPTSIALWVSCFFIFMKEALFRWTLSVANKQKSSLLVANAWHHRTDAITSLVALLGIIGSQNGMPYLDPLAGILVAGLVVKIGIQTSIAGVKELVDASVEPAMMEEAKKILSEMEGVRQVKSIKCRKMGLLVDFDIIIEVDGERSLHDSFHMQQDFKRKLTDDLNRVGQIRIELEPTEDEETPNRPSLRVLERMEDRVSQSSRAWIFLFKLSHRGEAPSSLLRSMCNVSLMRLFGSASSKICSVLRLTHFTQYPRSYLFLFVLFAWTHAWWDQTPGPLSSISDKAAVKTCNVLDYGARADNATDLGAPLLAALKNCSGGGLVVIPPGEYALSIYITITVNTVALQIDGTIYRNSTSGGHMLIWYKCKDLEIFSGTGLGAFQGWGYLYHRADDYTGPRFMRFTSTAYFSIHDIAFADGPSFNLICDHCRYGEFYNLAVRAADHGATDGIDLFGDNLWIHDVMITNKDECVTVKSPSHNILVENVYCNWSGGCAMGSLSTNTNISNIIYRNVYSWKCNQMYFTKSWGGNGTVSNVTLENFIGHSSAYGFFINEKWTQQTEAPGPGVLFSNIEVSNFTGSISNGAARPTLYINCDDNATCHDINVRGFELWTETGSSVSYSCKSGYGIGGCLPLPLEDGSTPPYSKITQTISSVPDSYVRYNSTRMNEDVTLSWGTTMPIPIPEIPDGFFPGTKPIKPLARLMNRIGDQTSSTASQATNTRSTDADIFTTSMQSGADDAHWIGWAVVAWALFL
ncbi:rhamnogalacturonase B [Planoprotostelium fungivorum]|uniref:Rhamnogalacturonase B n=1 Tax=Planoprotostelium fungivorum TaxID=1890364 RepID=A0A2P6NIX5_9EUKA|nr:rhamnogalacturonase B [Planoprotostelium fungivorum]